MVPVGIINKGFTFFSRRHAPNSDWLQEGIQAQENKKWNTPVDQNDSAPFNTAHMTHQGWWYGVLYIL